jgi:undecaprenyl-diphosphatase
MFDFLNRVEQSFVLFIQNNLSNSLFDWFFPFYTDLHKEEWFVLSVTLPFLVLWAYKIGKHKWPILNGFFLALIFTDGICGQLIKKIFGRTRPFEGSQLISVLSPASGYSFVSNHAANSFAVATYLSYFYPQQSLLFWILASLTAFSRVYNGVHYPTDVIIGALIGFGIAKIFIDVAKKLLSKQAGKI